MPEGPDLADWTATYAAGNPIMTAKTAAMAPIFTAVLSENRSQRVFRGGVDVDAEPIPEWVFCLSPERSIPSRLGSPLDESTCSGTGSPPV